MAMAFVPATAAATAVKAESKPKAELPVFGPRWHSFSRLDIRPVLWSLKNHPEEWVEDRYVIRHKPSNHEFWIANGLFFHRLYDSHGCSCQSNGVGSFSLIQKVQFRFALVRWRMSALGGRAAKIAAANAASRVDAQFAKHFIHE